MRRSWHSPPRLGAILLPTALALAGCTGDRGDGVARSAPFNRGRQLAISDELHNGGTRGFVFLPPMVPRPAYFGDFLPDLEPVVRIDEVRPDGTTIRTLATFTRDSGPSRERIRVHRQGEACDRDDDDGDRDPNGYFYARWFTHCEHLSTSGVYRARVFVQERVHPCTRPGWGRACRHGEDHAAPMREVGYADVDVVRNEREARFVDRDDYVPLINGQVLRIKFRIDRPVVDADGDGVYNWNDNCRDTPNRDQRDTNRDGEGDACECLGVTCAPSDACHVAGACNPATGLCSNPAAPNGAACPLANANGACASGACGVASCTAGFADCDANAANGCETATNTLAHCGACGVTCAAGAHASPTCATGTCALTCDAGWYDADGDRANGCELDITTDADCGRPGNACVSGAGDVTTCVAGACSTMACPAARANCNGAIADGCEVDTDGDVANCAACGRRCATPDGTPACTGGVCTIAACDVGHADCNGAAADGCEVNTLADVSHCGACGHACSLAHAAAVCAAGACAVGTCDAGWADVNGAPADGCEVDLATDPRHCGAVDNACAAPHATPACAAGACGIGACDVGFADCDGAGASGCEVNTLADVAHCGACDRACPSGAHGSATCGAGVCGLSCEAGFADCDGDATNGCEVDLLADGANCGACGTACTQGRTCQSGACSAAVCTAGRANCNGAEGDGCEVTLATSVSDCGACGNACSFAHAAAECAAGACGFSVCDVGFADVDGAQANGCEVDLRADARNCGAVGNACAAPSGGATACVGGVCAPSCPGAQRACAGACVDVTTSVAHCGACGNACPAGYGCTAGACAPLCAGGLTACGGACVSLSTDVANCGACDNACPSGYTCQAGTCRAPCGSFGQPCCATGAACGAGLSCNAQSRCGCASGFECGAACCAFGQICSAGQCANAPTAACLAWDATARDGGQCPPAGCPRTCLDIKLANPAALDGVYTIDPDGTGPEAPIAARCDMSQDGGGWTLVGYEPRGFPSPASANGAMAYLYARSGTAAAVASGAASGFQGARFRVGVNYVSARLNWCNPSGATPINRFMKFDTPEELFQDTRRDTFGTTIRLTGFTTNDAFLNTQIATPSDARFCRSATSFFRPGDTSWGVKGANDNAFSCGCNSGGWQGVGSYYGGINPSCSVCSCWGGGWSGSVTNGGQKGGLNSNNTYFWVR